MTETPFNFATKLQALISDPEATREHSIILMQLSNEGKSVKRTVSDDTLKQIAERGLVNLFEERGPDMLSDMRNIHTSLDAFRAMNDHILASAINETLAGESK
jgi:hypothetical protein